MIEERIKQQKIEKSLKIKANMPSEPLESDPNICNIIFRLPGSGERVSRRFLKT
jgi:hypothetical protein